MKFFAYLLFATCLLSACSQANRALINDVAVKAPDDSGYYVIGINGKNEIRLKSSFITVVPFVVLEAGRNTIDVVKKADLGSDAVSLSHATFVADVESGKRYRIYVKEGVFSLIEEVQK